MDLPGMEEIRIITRSDSVAPYMAKLVGRHVNDHYQLVGRENFGLHPVDRIDLETARDLSMWLSQLASERVSHLMGSFDLNVFGHEAELQVLRQDLGISTTLEYFDSLSNEKNEFHIDTYVNQHPDFLRRVRDFFAQHVGIRLNPNYPEENLAAAAFVLFGPLVVDYSWTLENFLAGRVRRILNLIKEGSLEHNIGNDLPHLVAFDRRLLPLIRKEIQTDEAEASFMTRLEAFQEHDEVTRWIVLDLVAPVCLLQVINNDGTIETEYLQIPRNFRREDFEEFVKTLDTKPKSRGVLDIDLRTTDELVPNVQDSVHASDELWLQLPPQYIGRRNIRHMFSAFNTARLTHWGRPREAKLNERSEKLMIILIEYTGLFGVSKRTARTILDDPTLYDNTDTMIISENAIAQMAARHQFDIINAHPLF